MSDRGDGTPLAAGGPVRHDPVLREEALRALAPSDGGLYVDGTFGAGGYSAAILAVPGTRVVGLDRDPDAVAAGRARFAHEGRIAIRHTTFGALDAVAADLALPPLDGIVLDIGVSSMQFDEGERGFSLRHDGPLDMRMSREGRSAADIVNGASDEDLADIFFHYGEERASRRLARAIAHDRQTTPFTSTRQLAEMIARVLPGKPGDIHPATRAFQALRIAVNDELGELLRGLDAAERLLAEGGRLVVVSFHSLEDRIVKRFLQTHAGRGEARSRHLPDEAPQGSPTFALAGKQPIVPGADEIARNPRSRSAKLRVGIRTAATARGLDPALQGLAALPSRRGR